MRLYQSEVNLLGNDLKTDEGNNVELLTSSSASLTPTYLNSQYYWYAGNNRLRSEAENILFEVGSEVVIDKGNNCFTVDNSDYEHIFGEETGNCRSVFQARNNYWSPFPPKSYIYCGQDIPLGYTPNLSSCPATVQEASGYQYIARGDLL